ncbi:MAG: ribosome maturation factor RimM [Clostridiales bacterium]|nr:ribosome maturation factor RimM [Clostridiales bacterium]
MQDRFQVGVISSTHGVAGEVKVFPTTDDVKRFKKLKHVILDTGAEELELEIAQVKFFKQMVILKFREFSNINEVERFRGKSLYVTRENAVQLQKDEYFIADMIGMRVITTDGEELGILQDVMQTGANDVYVVEDNGGEELLLPAIHDCVKRVDMEQGVITVFLMPGLRDIQ